MLHSASHAAACLVLHAALQRRTLPLEGVGPPRAAPLAAGAIMRAPEAAWHAPAHPPRAHLGSHGEGGCSACLRGSRAGEKAGHLRGLLSARQDFPAVLVQGKRVIAGAGRPIWESACQRGPCSACSPAPMASPASWIAPMAAPHRAAGPPPGPQAARGPLAPVAASPAALRPPSPPLPAQRPMGWLRRAEEALLGRKRAAAPAATAPAAAAAAAPGELQATRDGLELPPPKPGAEHLIVMVHGLFGTRDNWTVRWGWLLVLPEGQRCSACPCKPPVAARHRHALRHTRHRPSRGC